MNIQLYTLNKFSVNKAFCKNSHVGMSETDHSISSMPRVAIASEKVTIHCFMSLCNRSELESCQEWANCPSYHHHHPHYLLLPNMPRPIYTYTDMCTGMYTHNQKLENQNPDHRSGSPGCQWVEDVQIKVEICTQGAGEPHTGIIKDRKSERT